jgi:hypothetical protein
MASPFDLFTEAPAGASSTPTQTQPSRFDAFVGAGNEDLTKPAIMFRKQPAKALEARAVEVRAEEAKQSPFSDLYQDDKKFKTVYDYANSRFGKEGDMKDGETREDYIGRWASHMRMTSNNLLSGTQELQYLNNAKRQEILKAKEAYDIWDNTAGYLSPQGGQGGVKPVLDMLGAVVSDPTTAISLGAGKIAASTFMKTASEKGLQAAIKSRLGTLATVPVVEGSGAALSDVTAQKIDLNTTKAQVGQMKELLPKLSPEQQAAFQPQIDALQAKVDAGVSGTRAAVAGAIGAIGGTLETGALVGAAKKINKAGASTQLEDILASRTNATQVNLPKIEVKAIDPTEKALEDAYDIFEGRKLLDAEGKPTSVAEMQIRNDVNKKATEVASEIWKRSPELAPVGDQKISDAVKNVFMNIENIDDAVLADSLAKAGVTAEDFARMNRTTVGDAGRTLQAYSVLARLQNKLKSIDPAAAKQVDEMYGNRNAITSAFTGVRDFGMRLDRELKALMVSQVATTIRNGFSGAAVVTFGTASEAIESALYRVGKTGAELIGGKPVTGSFTGGLKGVYDDAVRTAFYLGEAKLSSQTAERLLADSPSLHNLILRTAGESGPGDLSKVAQMANTLNVAQDAFFRQAVFTSSVEKQLSRVGINMYDVMAQGKSIPFDVLKNATDEALTATFSKMPTKGPMFHAVKFVEELGPIGSTVIPFPRFMANAMSWTYKHSPMGIFSGATDIAVGVTKQAKGDVAGVGQTMQGLENASKGMVGTAAIYAAYKYREENQDTNWYDIKNPDGSLVDARALFPASPFLAMGDYLVKFNKGRTDEFKTKEFLEAMTGFKAPAGTYSWLGDKFAEASSNMQTGEGGADQKVSTFFGEWAGEYLGRALVPVQQISDIIGAIDRDETLPRDAYQIPAGEEGFASSAKNQLMKRTPIVKQELPVYQPAVKEAAPFNDAGPLKMFTGITVKGKPTELEEEITTLKIPFNKIFTSTGDKIVDAEARKVMAPLLLQTYETVKNTEWYQSASPDVKKIALQNTLAFAQTNAKKIATNQSAADAFAKGEGARIFAVKYSALPPEVKRATAEMYQQQTGKSLEDTKEYQAALSYAAAIRKQPGFAAGGLASDIASRMVGKAATKSAGELLQEMQEVVSKRALSTTEQTTKALPAPTKAPVLAPTEAPRMTSKVVKKDDPFTPTIDDEAGVVGRSAFDDFVDTPAVSVNKAVAAPVPETTSPFTADQYSAGEAAMKAKYGDALFESKKKFFPETYAEELHYETANASGLSGDKVPAYKSADELAVDEIQYDMDGNPIDASAPAPVVKSLVEKPLKDATWKAGDLGTKVQDTTSSRKKALEEIRTYRTDAYKDLINNNVVKALPDADTVAAVAQGDFRFKTGRELNPKNAKDMAEFVNMAQQYQNNLDKLRVKYKDVPDIKLYHGSTSYRSTGKDLAENGFNNPQTDTRQHSELNIGGVSFTKDVNLNFETGDFGGKKAEQFVYTQMPYADYVFQRINMTPIAYDSKNLNVVARSINGSSNVVRPISLPRSGAFKETEDVFVEADKLMPVDKAAGKQPRLQWGKDEIEGKLATKVQQPTGTGPFPETPVLKIGGEDRIDIEKAAKERLFGLSNKLDRVSDPAIRNRLAYNAYDGIRSLLNNAMDRASITSTKTGMGQRYQKFLEDLSDSIVIGTYPDKQSINTRDFINNVATILEQSGPNQKAKALRELNDKLDQINSGQNSRSAIKAVDEVRKLTQKFAKGGLASRR